jgi:hypothetical protein
MASRRFGVVLGFSWPDRGVVGGLLVGLCRSLKAIPFFFFVLFRGIIWVGYPFGYDVSGILGVILFRGCCVRPWLLCKGVMERQFLVDAKSFVFSVSEGGGDPAGR